MATRKKIDFEKQMARLQEIVTTLESSAGSQSLSLEKSVALYKEGVELARTSRAQLEVVRHEVRLATEEGLKPFATMPDDAEAE